MKRTRLILSSLWTLSLLAAPALAQNAVLPLPGVRSGNAGQNVGGADIRNRELTRESNVGRAYNPNFGRFSATGNQYYNNSQFGRTLNPRFFSNSSTYGSNVDRTESNLGMQGNEYRDNPWAYSGHGNAYREYRSNSRMGNYSANRGLFPSTSRYFSQRSPGYFSRPGSAAPNTPQNRFQGSPDKGDMNTGVVPEGNP